MTLLPVPKGANPEPEFSRARDTALLWLILSCLAVLFARLWYLQVVLGAQISEEAERYRTQSVRKAPMRGRIVDRNGVTIAKVQAQDVVLMVPSEAFARPDSVSFLARVLGQEEERIYRILRAAPNPNLATPVAVGLTLEQYVALAEEQFLHPAIRISEEPIRYYPDGVSFAHAVGYVGPASPDDLERFSGKEFDPADFVGKVGVERAQERWLHGRPGIEALEVDAVGRPISPIPITHEPPEPGSTLVLTLDSRLQKKANELLRGRIGAVVALDPRNGEVLALTGSPSFDANLFASKILPEDWAALRDDPKQPMLNRALQSAYPPASTFKVVTAIAGINAGMFSPHWSTVCTGAVQVGKRTFRCHRVHGRVDLVRAISLSCDSYFYRVALVIGPDRLRSAALDAGFGKATGIDLPNERTGLVPTDQWLRKRNLRWRGGDTANMSIGQGYLLATPLQMANLAALMANRGVAYQPHIVRYVLDPMTGRVQWRASTRVLLRLDTTAPGWDAIQQGMLECIRSGTGTRARIQGLEWSGKTGSAEHGGSKKTHAWFIGYAPAHNPRIAVAVLLERAGHGGEQAAPLAAELIRTYLMPEALHAAAR